MAPPKGPDQGSEVDSREFCRTCNAVFMNYKALHLHKLGAADHLCCPVCSADFVTAEGFKRHYNQMHAAQQDLQCPGCGERFVRVGSLVSHIEMNMCRVISAAKFGDVREAKAKWHSDNHNATAFAQYGAGFEGINEAGNVPKPPNASATKQKTATGPAQIPRGPSVNAYEDAWSAQPQDVVAAHHTRSAQRAWSSSDTDTGGAHLALKSTDLLHFESPEKRDGWVDDEYKPATQGIRAQPGPRADHLPLVVSGWANGPSRKVEQSGPPTQENHKPRAVTSQTLHNEPSGWAKTESKPTIQNDFPPLPSQKKQARAPVAVVKLKLATQQSVGRNTWTTAYGTKKSLPALIPDQVAASPERTYICKTCAEAFPGIALPEWTKTDLEDHARKFHRLQDHEISKLYPPEPEHTYFCKLCTEAMPDTKFEKMTKVDLETHGRVLHRLREHELHELCAIQSSQSSTSSVQRPVGEVPTTRSQTPPAVMRLSAVTTTNSQRPAPATSAECPTQAASSQRPAPTTLMRLSAVTTTNSQRPTSTTSVDHPAPVTTAQHPAAAAQLLKAPATTKPIESPTPSPQPPTGPIQTLTVDEGEEWRPHDPSNPKFNLKSYWIAALEKYKCPHVACKKSFAAPSAFIQHLRSSTHMNNNLQCMNCLRYFGSATALTQHCEAQTTRCLIRETENYGAALDIVTAGTAAPAGRHADDTIRYVTNDIGLVGGSQSFIQAHKKAQAVKEAKNASYWDNKSPDW